jgi:hypothetical protein
MEKKYLKAIECLAEVIMKQEDELRFKNYEIESLKNKIKKFEDEVSNRKENK